MADFEFASLVTESHRFRNGFRQHRWAPFVNERQVHRLSSLMATPDAAELVISFLQRDRCHNNLLWLSNSLCLSKNEWLDEMNYDYSTGIQHDEGEGSIEYVITFNFETPTNKDGQFFLYGLRSAELSSLVPVVDALVQLLARHKTLSEVQLRCNPHLNFAQFPVSVPALETLVGHGTIFPRRVGLFDFRLSAEQCRVLLFGRNDNIELCVHADETWNQEGFAILTEALTLHQTPTILLILNLKSLPNKDVCNAFLAAIEYTTSLLELCVQEWLAWDAPTRLALIRAIGRNKGLQVLNLQGALLTSTEWRILWEESLSRHPTIRTVKITDTLPRAGRRKQRRDEVMVRSIRTNTVLTEIQYTEEEHGPSTMQELVLPVLGLNLFRPHIQAIRQIPNDAVRWSLFGKALLHPHFQQYPSLLFHLFLANSDGVAALVKPTSETENSIARRVTKRCRRLVASK